MILYIRQGCHLCDAFLDEMSKYDTRWKDRLSILDVDDSEQTQKAYGEHVPAVVLGDQIICQYFFDSEQLSPYFQD